jgi:hypothetical protein
MKTFRQLVGEELKYEVDWTDYIGNTGNTIEEVIWESTGDAEFLLRQVVDGKRAEALIRSLSRSTQTITVTARVGIELDKQKFVMIIT